VTAGATPLLDLFFELRQRNFPLSTSDYMTALEALVVGNGVTTRADLTFMCQLVWAKSPEEQKQVAEALAEALPIELSEEELIALNREAEQVLPAPRPPAAPKFEPPTPSSPSVPEPTTPQERSGETQALPAAGELKFSVARTSGGELVAMPVARSTWHMNPHLDFVGSLPVTKRQMKRAWRYYRRMRRTGPAVELDVEATIEEIYRRGIFLKPVMIPRRLNQARMLVLMDEQGSMVPFRRVTQALLESATQSGLARASVFFFHDVPGRHLFHDPWLSRPEVVERVLGTFIDSGVLIISDGGAARGRVDPNRFTQTKEFIQKVRWYTPNVAWLNPTPTERWPGTTAENIREQCTIPMFELDRAGLDAAVGVLKGKGH
jgi:uncharacterized protein